MPPVKVPVVAFAAVTAAVPVAFSRVVLFIAFVMLVMRVAALVIAVVRGLVVIRLAARIVVVGLVSMVVVVGLVRAVVITVNGLVVVCRITGSVSDLLIPVRRGALTVVVLTFAVRAVCENLLACVLKVGMPPRDLVRLTVFARVDVTSWVNGLVTVASVASFVTVDVKGLVVAVNFLLVVTLVVCPFC